MGDWTIDSLRIHLERVIAEVDRRHTEAMVAHERMDFTRHDAAEKAIEHASNSLERRLDGMNEFRNQLRDQAGSFLPRNEYNVAHEALVSEVKRFSELVLAGESRSRGRSDVWGWIIGAAGLTAALLTIVARLVA